MHSSIAFVSPLEVNTLPVSTPLYRFNLCIFSRRARPWRSQKSDSQAAKLVWEQRRQASSKSILAMSELVNLIVNKITAKLN